MILIPYFSWRSTHRAHHVRIIQLNNFAGLTVVQKAVGSIERDEVYVPHTRSDMGLPPQDEAQESDYAHALEEAPLMTLLRLLIMQGM
jgi:hypothetical protein